MITKVIAKRHRRQRFPVSVKLKIAASQHWTCNVCKQMLSEHFDLDHKTSLDQGGDNTQDNLQILCVTCHRQKTAQEGILRNGCCPHCFDDISQLGLHETHTCVSKKISSKYFERFNYSKANQAEDV